MKRFLVIIVGVLALTSCHTHKQASNVVPAEPITLNNSDSVTTETIVKTVYVPIRVEVPVPQQSVVNISEADTSHIETDVAESDAWIRPDGSLYHTLQNKDVSLSAETYLPETTTNSNKAIIKEREVAVPKPYPVYVEKSLSKWVQFKLSAFWYLVGAALLAGVYILRKPLLILIRKILFK